MNNFNDQFKHNSAEIVLTAEMLDEDKFWKIVDKSLKKQKVKKNKRHFW